MTDFAAIDFETANEQPSSVCSVGVVIGATIADNFGVSMPQDTIGTSILKELA